MMISTGTRFGQYEITAPLGKGGMGEVYLARDTRLERQVALKILPLDFTQSHDRLRRFEQEAKTVSALNHPNILTIHEIGAQNGTHFITTEFIAGQTLRDRLQQPLSQSEAIDIALQIAHALAAAHEANIIHRDIKPENVMLRTDGIVKVLDFGLAKLTERKSEGVKDRLGEDDATLALPAPDAAVQTTEAGMVMGTASYMSPEQARGQKMDARTDIFSLGVVLYEMLAGKRPFAGVNMIDVLGAILHEAPAPLSEAPSELQRIVMKALQKDRAARYQTAQEFARDLKEWKDELAYHARAARTSNETERLGAEGLGVQASCLPLASESDANSVVRENAEDQAIPSQGERAALHALAAGKMPALPGAPRFASKRAALVISLLALVLVAATAYFFLNRKAAPAFAEREPILLADFENKTGEEIWDGTLKQALAVALEQSPYMNIFPDERARDTLRLMNRSVDDPITRATGREICQRRNVRALLIGTIAKLERSYTVTLEATNAQSGETIARTLEQAAGRDEVVNALGRAAKDLRGKLGESLVTLQKYDKPLEEATTSSLEALKLYSKGRALTRLGQYEPAIPLLKRATELDEKFALGWMRLGDAYALFGNVELRQKYYEVGYRLRERASERERLAILNGYCWLITGEMEKRTEASGLAAQTYPEDYQSLQTHGSSYRAEGQFEKAIEIQRESFRLNPDNAVLVVNLAQTMLSLGRYEEAEKVIREGLARKLDTAGFHYTLYRIALAKHDAAEANKQVEWFTGKSAENRIREYQAQAAAFAGQRHRCEELYQQAATLAQARNFSTIQTQLLAERARWNAILGQIQIATEQAAQVLSLARRTQADIRLLRGEQPFTLASQSLAFTFALGGKAEQAQSLADEVKKKLPLDTLSNNVWLPLIQATIELKRNHPDQTIQLLQSSSQYEPVAYFLPNWIRAQAYLQLKQGAQAAAEFQKIIDHRGWDVTSPLWPLAYLGSGRAAVLQGDVSKAKQLYDEFFRLWKDADADLPVLIEAKKEYARLP